MIKLNGNGEKGFLTGKIDIKSLIINLQSLLCLGMWVLGWRKYVNINQVLQGDLIKYSLNIPTENIKKYIFTICPGFQPLFS